MGTSRSYMLHRYWGRWMNKEETRDMCLVLVNVVLVETGKRIKSFPGE